MLDVRVPRENLGSFSFLSRTIATACVSLAPILAALEYPMNYIVMVALGVMGLLAVCVLPAVAKPCEYLPVLDKDGQIAEKDRAAAMKAHLRSKLSTAEPH